MSARGLTKRLLDVVQDAEAVDVVAAAETVLAVALTFLPLNEREKELRRIEEEGFVRRHAVAFMTATGKQEPHSGYQH